MTKLCILSTGEMIELRTKGKRLGCMEPHSGEETEGTNIDAKARQVTLIKEASWYTLKCQQLKVLLATDWNIPMCFKELPVWIRPDEDRRSLRFLAPGSRLLLNSS